jgi:mannose-binding lectin 2
MPLSVLNWQVDVEFQVNGKANNLFGDGFAIWLSKDRAKLGTVFGSIGMLAIHRSSVV